MSKPQRPETVQDKFERTFEDLDTWRLRTREPWRSHPNSELADDDMEWPWPVTQMLVALLASARDHLDAVRFHILDEEPYPFADATLLRTALLSASQAVWVLSPNERGERVRRSRIVLLAEYTQHLKFLEDTVKLSVLNDGTEHAATVTVRDWVRMRKKEVTRLRERDGETETFNATNIIERAAVATFGSEVLGHELRVEWRRGSAAAHGLVWSVLGLSTTRTVSSPDEQGIVQQKAVGGLEAIGNLYLGVYLLLRRGWELAEQRGRARSAP